MRTLLDHLLEVVDRLEARALSEALDQAIVCGVGPPTATQTDSRGARDATKSCPMLGDRGSPRHPPTVPSPCALYVKNVPKKKENFQQVAAGLLLVVVTYGKGRWGQRR